MKGDDKTIAKIIDELFTEYKKHTSMKKNILNF